MPELFAVLSTMLTIMGYAVCLLLLAGVVLPILAGVIIATVYAVCVIRGAIELVTDVEGEAE